MLPPGLRIPRLRFTDKLVQGGGKWYRNCAKLSVAEVDDPRLECKLGEYYRGGGDG